MDIEVQRKTKDVTPSPEPMSALDVLMPRAPVSADERQPTVAEVDRAVTTLAPPATNKRLTLLENAKVVDWLLANRETVITKPSVELAARVTDELGFDVSKAEINLRRNQLGMQRVKPKPDAPLLPEQQICEAIADLADVLSRLCASDEERQRIARIQARFSGFSY